MREVFRSAYYTVAVDGSFARVTRSPAAFPSLDEVVRANAEVATLMLGASGIRRMLLDLRGGPPGRNDADFEAASESARRQFARLERVAILVRTAAGKLQAQRLSPRSEGVHAFQDEREALEWLNE